MFISTSLTLFMWSSSTYCFISFTFSSCSVKYNKQLSSSNNLLVITTVQGRLHIPKCVINRSMCTSLLWVWISCRANGGYDLKLCQLELPPHISSQVAVYMHFFPDSDSNQFISEPKRTFVQDVKQFLPGVPDIIHQRESDSCEVAVSLTFYHQNLIPSS